MTSCSAWDRRGRDRMVVGFIATYMQLVPITTNVVSSNPARGEVYSIQHHVIKFVSDFRQVGGFLRFPPIIRLAPQYNWNIVESGIKHHNLNTPDLELI